MDLASIWGFVTLVSIMLSCVIAWLYLRRMLSLQKQHLTRREKYVIPLLVFAGLSLIPSISFTFLLAFSASSEVEFEDWILAATFPLSCFGVFFIGFAFTYLVYLWWYGQKL